MPGPGLVGGTGVHGDLVSGPDDLEPYLAPLGQHQRRLDGQFLDLVTGSGDDLDESGTRKQDRTREGVVGQPRMGTQRNPPGADDLVGTGDLDRGVQQPVAGGFQPVPRPLEGVRGQVDPATAQDRRPVQVDALYVRFGQR